jgi:hypothetical protein
MQVISAKVSGRWSTGQLHCRKKPLPDEILGGIGVLPLQGIYKKDARIAPIQVPLVKVLERLEARSKLRKDTPGKRDRSTLPALAVVNGQDLRVEIEALNAQLQTLEQAKPAAVQELDYEVEGGREVRRDLFDLIARQHHRDVGLPLRTHNPFHSPELLPERMAM